MLRALGALLFGGCIWGIGRWRLKKKYFGFLKIKYFENSDIEVVIELIGNEGYLKRVSDEETHLNFLLVQ